jgi:hypothetical protein
MSFLNVARYYSELLPNGPWEPLHFRENNVSGEKRLPGPLPVADAAAELILIRSFTPERRQAILKNEEVHQFFAVQHALAVA